MTTRALFLTLLAAALAIAPAAAQTTTQIRPRQICCQPWELSKPDVSGDYVVYGLNPTAPGSGLSMDTPTGVLYVNGVRITVAAVSAHAYTASKDTYVDLMFVAATSTSDASASYTYTAVTNGAAPPAIAANTVRVFKVVTGASAISSVTDLRRLSPYLDLFSDFVVSGLLATVPANALTTVTPRGVAYVKGLRVTTEDTSQAYTASKDTYVDVKYDGTFTYTAVANGAGAPAIADQSIRVFKVVTDGTHITSVTDLRTLTEAYTATQLTLSTSPRLLGRTTAGQGPAEEISVGANLTLSGGTLSAAGSGISGSGSVGQATFWTGTSAISGDNGFWWDNTNKHLGIGTAAPVLNVEVKGLAPAIRLNNTALNGSTVDWYSDVYGTTAVAALYVGGTTKITAYSGGLVVAPSGTLVTSDWVNLPAIQVSAGTGTFGGISIASNRADGAGTRIGSLAFETLTNTATRRALAVVEAYTEGTIANQRGGELAFLVQASGAVGPIFAGAFHQSGGFDVGGYGDPGSANLGVQGLFKSNGNGEHFAGGSNNGDNSWRLINSSAGASARAYFRLSNDVGSSYLMKLGSGNTSGLSGVGSELTLLQQEASPLVLAATNASGSVNIYTGGATLTAKFWASRGVDIGGYGDPGATNLGVQGIIATKANVSFNTGAVQTNGNVGSSSVTVYSSVNQLDIGSSAAGTGVYGNGVSVERNTSGSGAPGWFGAMHRSGTAQFLFPDSNGVWRTQSGSPPVEAGATGDLVGTILGFQTETNSSATLTCDNSTKNTAVATSTGNVIRLSNSGTDTGNCLIAGLAGGTAGRVILVANVDLKSLQFNYEDAAEGTAANRISGPGASQIVISSGNIALLYYDGTTSRWRIAP